MSYNKFHVEVCIESEYKYSAKIDIYNISNLEDAVRICLYIIIATSILHWPMTGSKLGLGSVLSVYIIKLCVCITKF